MSDVDPFWEALITAFLHDLPDKAPDVTGSERPVGHFRSSALGEPPSREAAHREALISNALAMVAEQVPMPIAAHDDFRAIGADAERRLELRHPMDGSHGVLDVARLVPGVVAEAVARVTGRLETPRDRFLALWRLLPEVIAETIGTSIFRLPADSRLPDHSIWHHADIASGYAAALSGGGGAGLLTVTLGPVQPFIAAARSLRDLWTGSLVLSWLNFAALRPVIETLGPTAVVFPALRNNPLVDLWLRETTRLGDRIPPPSIAARRLPSLPNRFLALVPLGDGGILATDMAARCEAAAHDAWRELAGTVRAGLDERIGADFSGWDRLWHDQIEAHLDVRSSVLSLPAADEANVDHVVGGTAFDSVAGDAARIRALEKLIPLDDRRECTHGGAGRWQAVVDLAGRLAEAGRTDRYLPPYVEMPDDSGQFPSKCTLLGSFGQMGPAGLEQSRRFWSRATECWQVEGVRLRAGERFCAVALTKRFAIPLALASRLGIPRERSRFPDTATVAAATWLQEAGIDLGARPWNGRWLHPDPADDDMPPLDVALEIDRARYRLGRQPPTYLAVLAMDGDRMGAWLAGERSPTLREVLHPKLVHYFAGRGDEAVAALDARRPVGPALHGAISEALSAFAGRVAPAIVERHQGTLIYAGGDDLLALLPRDTVLGCARDLRNAFAGDDPALADDLQGWLRLDGRPFLSMGSRASLSAGIAITHHRGDLRRALDAARAAQRAAKVHGRDAFAVALLKRSGEEVLAPAAWPMAAFLDTLRRTFAMGASDRWTYRMRALMPTIAAPQMPLSMAEAELRRLLHRQRQAGETAGVQPEAIIAALREHAGDSERRAGGTTMSAIEPFIVLCQAAAFLARGDDA